MRDELTHDMLSHRLKELTKEPVDITPKNGSNFPWTGQDTDKFENEWSMKPVEINGIMDLNKQVFIDKRKDGEKGVEVVAPMWTHLDKDDKPCGILVSRGWLPDDLKNMKLDKDVDITKVKGVLYRGDAQNIHSKHNNPMLN